MLLVPDWRRDQKLIRTTGTAVDLTTKLALN